MSLKVPKNRIKTNYTNGGEYVIADTGVRYQGYYHEVEGKIYTGKDYNTSGSVLLIKPTSEEYNQLLSKSSTFTYSAISNIKLNNPGPIPSSTYNNIANSVSFISTFVSEGFVPPVQITRYFIKKVNSKEIKEVDQPTFNKFTSNPLYIGTTVLFESSPGSSGIPQNLYEAEKIIPGITDFLYDKNVFFKGDNYPGGK